ncbi:MAG: hypothetical protein ACKVWV_11270 [Planctomycetota bacterium]
MQPEIEQANATPQPPRAWKRIGVRVLYWSPVFGAMVLFAQIALLGLRPALSERRRLAEAEVTLRERHARDEALCRAIDAHLQARGDPIFRERQRRLRQATTLASN